MGRMDYYVYLHRRADNNEVFYVGKGRRSRATECGRGKGRSQWWNRIVAKYGYVVEYVERGLSEESAFDLEIETIKFYRDNGHNLCNMTDGGEGSSGRKLSEETYAKHVTRVNSPEFKAMIKAAIGRPVICSNGMKFETCKDAEIWLGNALSSSKVSTCCRRKTKSANGYIWRFQDDADDLMELLSAGKDAFVELGGMSKLKMVLRT